MSVAIFSETRRDSKSPSGAKNWRRLMPSAPVFALRPHRCSTSQSTIAPTMAYAGSAALHLVSSLAYARTTTKRPALRLAGAPRTSLRSPCARRGSGWFGFSPTNARSLSAPRRAVAAKRMGWLCFSRKEMRKLRLQLGFRQFRFPKGPGWSMVLQKKWLPNSSPRLRSPETLIKR